MTRTIDITPTWAGILPLLLEGYNNGTETGRKIAKEELYRLCRIADEAVAAEKAATKATDDSELPELPRADVARSEREYYPVWAKANPDLFTRSVWAFKDAHPVENWKHHISLHGSTIKLIATRRAEPYDLERDFLNEIGLGLAQRQTIADAAETAAEDRGAKLYPDDVQLPELPVGTRVRDKDGYEGTIVRITHFDGSFWYDVRLSGGVAVRYPTDLELI